MRINFIYEYMRLFNPTVQSYLLNAPVLKKHFLLRFSTQS